MKNLVLNKSLATGIGSFPHQNTDDAVRFILSCFKDDIIFWPQLPKKSFLEQMTFQFSEKLPGVVIDSGNKKISVDTQKDNFTRELEECFQHYLDEDLGFFAVSREYASGLYALTDALSKNNNMVKHGIIKGQIVGPITFGMMIMTEQQQPIIYHPELKEALVKLLSMRAAWQVEKLKKINSNNKIIIFIDEPYLVSFGSSFFTLKKEYVIDILNEVAQAIHKQGALCGIHCCANTDWPLIFSTRVDIISFDAYGYLDNFMLYADELKSFLGRGGVLSLGIVPNSEEAKNDNKKEELIVKVEEARKKVDSIGEVLISSSCGCGTLGLGLSEDISRLSCEIASSLSRVAS